MLGFSLGPSMIDCYNKETDPSSFYDTNKISFSMRRQLGN
jgi:hypothetical protein